MKQLLTLLLFVPSLCLAQLPDYVPTDSLVAWYPLDGNGSGSTFASGDAAVMGAQPTTDRFGNPEGAMLFDGNDNLSIPSSPWNVVSPQFSFSIWYNVNTPGSISTYIVEKGSTSDGWEYALSFEPNGEARFIIHEANGAGGYLVFQGGQIGEGWNHVGFSFDMSGSSFLALNDVIVEQPTSPNGNDPQPGTSTLNLGARRGWASHPDPYGGLNGALDDFAFWNRALTPSEMQALYIVQTGCTDTSACNYNPLAVFDDGSCISCEVLASACGEGTVWDSNTSTCIVANPTDTDLDGCTGVGDVLEVLSTFGQCYTAADTTWTCGDPVDYWDYDYATVLIGDQCWFAENLHSTLYSDGTEIPEVTDGLTWADLGTGAWCSYNNSISNSESYGLLYNWHTVNSVSGLCPSDWHVPSDAEWIILEIQLGMPEDEAIEIGIRGNQGFHMKSTSGWNSNGNGSNSSGFSGLPGGDRYNNGSFANIGDGGYWWTSTASAESEFAFYRNLSPFNNGVSRFDYYQTGGFSVRCIKD